MQLKGKNMTGKELTGKKLTGKKLKGKKPAWRKLEPRRTLNLKKLEIIILQSKSQCEEGYVTDTWGVGRSIVILFDL